MNLTDKQLERIVKVANSKKIIQECEPNVVYHDTVHIGIAKRVLAAAEKVIKGK